MSGASESAGGFWSFGFGKGGRAAKGGGGASKREGEAKRSGKEKARSPPPPTHHGRASKGYATGKDPTAAKSAAGDVSEEEEEERGSTDFSSGLPSHTPPADEARSSAAKRQRRSYDTPTGSGSAAAAAESPPPDDDDEFVGIAPTAVPNSGDDFFELALVHDGDDLDDNCVRAGDLEALAFRGAGKLHGVTFFVGGLPLEQVSSTDELVKAVNRQRKKPLSKRRALAEISRIQVMRNPPAPCAAELAILRLIDKKKGVMEDEPMCELLEKTESSMGTVRVERSLRQAAHYVFAGRFFRLVGVHFPSAKFRVAWDAFLRSFPVLTHEPHLWEELEVHNYLALVIRHKEMSNTTSHVNEANKQAMLLELNKHAGIIRSRLQGVF